MVFSRSKAEIPPQSIRSGGTQGLKPMGEGLQSTEGWLILEGREVPPPFDIQVFTTITSRSMASGFSQELARQRVKTSMHPRNYDIECSAT
jgi:hypothetical protein